MPPAALLPEMFMSHRLRIGGITASDADFVVALLNSKGWLEGIGDRGVHTLDESILFIRKINQLDNFRYWAVRLLDGNEAIGVISCIKRDYLDHFDLGFAFLPQYNGKGYALEAASTVLLTLKRNPLFHRVFAFALPGNTRSIHLLTKLNFRFDRRFETQGDLVSLYINDDSIPATPANPLSKKDAADKRVVPQHLLLKGLVGLFCLLRPFSSYWPPGGLVYLKGS